jgi:outer membrane protein assembly factor BamB
MMARKTRSIAALVVGMAACSSEPEIGDANGMFRAGLSHPGVYPGGVATGLSGLQWRVTTGGAVRSSPTVHDGAVYVGDAAGFMYALDIGDGRERWVYDASSPVSSSPAVAAGRVFFGDRAGVLHAVAASDGSPEWQLRTGPDMALPWGNEGWDYYTSSPAVVGGVVIFGGGDGFLHAVDAATGERRWRYATDGRIRSSPAVAGGVVYVGSMDGRLHAVDVRTGEALWRFETEGYSLDSSEYGFDRRSIQSSPAVADGRVFFGSRDGHLYAVDAASGELLWRFDQEVSWCISSPAVEGGIVYVGTSDGHFVQALDAATGEEMWRTGTESRVFASPSIAGGTLVVGDQAGNLLALDRSTGDERWRYVAGDAIQSSAAIVGDLVVVGSDDGVVQALRASAGPGTLRALFWDGGGFSFYQGHEALRDHLASAGYQLLDATTLAGFMSDRLADGARSVVVFAMDHVPQTVGGPAPADTVLFRRYLDGGGRVVWLGLPPFSLQLDEETGQPVGLDLDRTTSVLGVDHSSVTGDEYPAWATPVGEAWGLPMSYVDQMAVDPGQVTIALALDERGKATAWVRRYGDRGALIRFWGRQVPLPDPGVVRLLAERELW